VNCYPEGTSQINYAVLSDGSVWEWKHGSDAVGTIAAVILVLGGGILAGILVGIVVASVLWVST
jgi:MFS superfamily sulfate permease-like transporter